MSLTETVRVMVRTPGAVDEMGEPVVAWEPVDVPGCLVRPLYRDADADAAEAVRPDAAQLTLYVAMDSSLIDCSTMRGARLRFPDRYEGDALAANEFSVVGIPFPTPQSPLSWDVIVEAVAHHG